MEGLAMLAADAPWNDNAAMGNASDGDRGAGSDGNHRVFTKLSCVFIFIKISPFIVIFIRLSLQQVRG
jgi:hypothetical protein